MWRFDFAFKWIFLWLSSNAQRGISLSVHHGKYIEFRYHRCVLEKTVLVEKKLTLGPHSCNAWRYCLVQIIFSFQDYFCFFQQFEMRISPRRDFIHDNLPAATGHPKLSSFSDIESILSVRTILITLCCFHARLGWIRYRDLFDCRWDARSE